MPYVSEPWIPKVPAPIPAIGLPGWFLPGIPASGAPLPALTQAQADDATDATQGSIDGDVLEHAIAKRAGQSLTPTVAAGQTAFTLPTAPLNPVSVVLKLNGVRYSAPDVTVAGTTVTWAGGFTLAPTDVVRIIYT